MFSNVCMGQMVYSVCVILQKHLQPCCCLTLHISQRTINTCENTQPSISWTRFFFCAPLNTGCCIYVHFALCFLCLSLSLGMCCVVCECSRNRLNGSSRLCLPYVEFLQESLGCWFAIWPYSAQTSETGQQVVAWNGLFSASHKLCKLIWNLSSNHLIMFCYSNSND